MKTLQLHVLAVLCCYGLTTSLFAQSPDKGSITLKDDKGHEVKLIPQKNAPLGSWVYEIPYGLPSGSGGHQTPQANPLADEPYITFATGTSDLSNNRVFAVGSGLSLTTGSTDNTNITVANTGVLSLTGTANQVSVSGSTGNVTLSLPQNIHSGASPTFTNASLTALPASSTFSNIVVSNGGALETRTIASLGKADASEPLLTFTAGSANMTNNRVLSPGSGITFTVVGADNGAFTVENSGVITALGTANQVNVSASTGNVTFSLPQNIHAAATPTFNGMTLSALPASSGSGDIVVSNAGVMETRTIASLGKADGTEPIVTFGIGSAGLTNNRVLTAGTGIAINDAGGDNGALTISTTTNGWSLTGNNFAVGDFIGGEAGNANPLDLRTNNTTRLKLNDDASLQRDDAGDPRGAYSNDMQAYRSSNDQVASGMLATIGGGGDNRATTIIGGTVAGGIGNTAGGSYYNTVAGGSGNRAIGFQSSMVGGGMNNTASHNYATVGGGKSNNASGAGSFIGGGGYDGSSTGGNQAGGPGSSIVGGFNNYASLDLSTVGGGSNNISSGYASAIAGGDGNQALDYGSAVGGGAGNFANEFLTTVSGGGGNSSNGEISTISGGLSNTAYGAVSTIGGGQQNTANTDSSTIAGGSYNTTFGVSTTVGGGSSNRAYTKWATVAGGHNNYAGGGTSSTIGGGDGNTANAQNATVAGGHANNASHANSTVSGGDGNWGANTGATVGGGLGNTADGPYATVAGGTTNTASGSYSAIVGGTGNVATADRSTAMGYQANAARFGQASHAGGRFATTGDAQGSLAVLRNSTSGLTTSELYLDGASLRFAITNNSAVTYSILVVGKSSDGESAGYEFRGIIERAGGTTSMIGTPVKTVLGEDDAAWDVTVSADNANGSLKIDVTGNSSDTIRWVATIRTSEVTY